MTVILLEISLVGIEQSNRLYSVRGYISPVLHRRNPFWSFADRAYSYFCQFASLHGGSLHLAYIPIYIHHKFYNAGSVIRISKFIQLALYGFLNIFLPCSIAARKFCFHFNRNESAVI